jgi:hypothetical protein
MIDRLGDERFIMHRYKATRLATMVGMIMMFAYVTFEIVVHRIIRWEIFVIMAAIAATKSIAMLYYRRTN